MKRLLQYLFRLKSKSAVREFVFISYHSRLTETQTDYRIMARDDTEATQMLKLYLQERRNNTRFFSHPVKEIPHRRSFQQAYCLKTDCMGETSADKLARQYYRIDEQASDQANPLPKKAWLFKFFS